MSDPIRIFCAHVLCKLCQKEFTWSWERWTCFKWRWAWCVLMTWRHSRGENILFWATRRGKTSARPLLLRGLHPDLLFRPKKKFKIIWLSKFGHQYVNRPNSGLARFWYSRTRGNRPKPGRQPDTPNPGDQSCHYVKQLGRWIYIVRRKSALDHLNFEE